MDDLPETSDCLTTEAFYVQRTDSPSLHFLGGPSPHAGTDCAECGREVTLTWELDLTAPEIPTTIRLGFGSLRRLPLYVCSQCNALSYRVVDDETIVCFPHVGQLEWCFEDESPHFEARAEIARQPIHLHRMPPGIDKLWVKRRYLRYRESLDDNEAAALQKYHDSLEVPPDDLDYYSQLGGDPYWIQGGLRMTCPYDGCVGRQHNGTSEVPVPMKRLAHISPPDSPGLGDSIGYFDYQFLVCPSCFSIKVQYECT